MDDSVWIKERIKTKIYAHASIHHAENETKPRPNQYGHHSPVGETPSRDKYELKCVCCRARGVAGVSDL